MRGAVLVGVVVAIACSANAEARSFALIDYYDAHHGGFYAAALTPVAPVTGRQVPGRTVRLRDAVTSHVLSPDRRVLAFGGYNLGEVVRVDLAHMRLLAPIRVGEADLHVLAWPSQRRLLALTGPPDTKWPAPSTLRVVDPVAGRVLASLPLGLVHATSTSAAGQVVVVAGPADGIGATRLVTAAPDGAMRVIELPHITSGDTTQARRIPGLAVDFAAQRAWVIGGGEPVAEVDLATGVVQDRPALAASTAPAGPPHDTGTLNATTGPWRMAQWLGDGLIAVAGSDAATVGFEQTDTPAGLRILDTRTWTERTIEPNANTFTLVGPTLLTARNGYATDGTRRFRLPTSHWRVQQDRLYVYAHRHHVQLRDPAGGALLRSFPADDNLVTLFSVRAPL